MVKILFVALAVLIGCTSGEGSYEGIKQGFQLFFALI